MHGRLTSAAGSSTDEGGAAARRRLDVDAAAVRLHEAARDGEAETGAGAMVAPGPQAVVRLEDAPPLGLGHAVPVIDDRDAQRLAVARRVHAERVVGSARPAFSSRLTSTWRIIVSSTLTGGSSAAPSMSTIRSPSAAAASSTAA